MSIYRDIIKDSTSINNFLTAKQAGLRTEESRNPKITLPQLEIKDVFKQINYCCDNGYNEAKFHGWSIPISMKLYLMSQGYNVTEIKENYEVKISW